MVEGLKTRTDLNCRAARVLADHPRQDGRIPIEMFIGQERVWIKRDNLLGPIRDAAALTHEPYSRMSDVERTDVGMFFFANHNSTRIPGVRGRSVSLVDREPVTFCDSVPDPAPAPEIPFSVREGMIDKVEMLNVYEPIEAPAPAPAPTMGIGEGTDDDPFAGLKQHMEADGFDTSNMQTFSLKPGSHGKGATLEECLANAQASTAAPAPAPDRRAEKLKAFRERAGKLDPRTHYCIYCGSEGPISSKCVPCGFYRGTFCFPPKGGDTFMGRKLAYVSWPWQGDPEAPYVPAR